MDKRHADLINAVYAKTKNRQARWTKTEQSRQYALTFSTGLLLLERYTNSLTGTYFRFTIENQEGERLDEVIVPENSSGFTLVQDLYHIITRQEIGADDVIDAMMGELNGDSVLGS